MKSIRFFKNTDGDKLTLSIIINKKVLAESIHKFFVYSYVGVSLASGLLSGGIIFSCIDKMSITLEQFMLIIITGFIFITFVRIINREKFVKIENEIKQTCLDIWQRVSHMFDRK